MTVYEAYRTAYTARTTRTPRARRSVMVPIAVALATVLGVIVNGLRTVRREALTLAGLGLVCASAWTYATWSGLLASGAALLWLEYLTSPVDEGPAS